jgi:ABC-type multidrug transport system ATPase subunit
MSLVLDNLGKRYKNGTWGLRAFSLELEAGFVGIVGPPGSGKTTLIRLLSTVMAPTQGTICWDGRNLTEQVNAFRNVLGYVSQGMDVYRNLTGRGFLRYLASIRGIQGKRSRVAEVLEQVELTEVADRRMGSYSSEMRRRIGLAQAMLCEPRLLLVDSPGTSLSSQERHSFDQLLASLYGGTSGDGSRLILVATDDATDIAPFATSVALLKEGQLLASGPPAVLVQSVNGRVWSVTVDQSELVEMRRQYLISRLVRQGAQVQLVVVSAAKPHPGAVAIEPSLADAYACYLQAGQPNATLT